MSHEAAAPRSPFTSFLRAELTGGIFLLIATIVALVWANVAAGSYTEFWAQRAAIGPEWLQLDLTFGHWATDGLLAYFFLVAGIEVKRELVDGELRAWRQALLPICAAIGGMVAPPLVAIIASGGAAAHSGFWSIPVATDIAFALGVLALVSSRVPITVRVLLLSLAVLDDIVAIALIAILFTKDLELAWLTCAAVSLIVWVPLSRVKFPRGLPGRLLWIAALGAVSLVAWTAMHASGVHATVAGVMLGLLAPVRTGAILQRIVHPFSSAICVPVFALAAAGIQLGAILDIPGEPIAIAVALGLIIGKPLGITLGAYAAVRTGLSQLPAALEWRHVIGLGMLGGIGYTVSLLIAQLTADSGSLRETLSGSVLIASAISAIIALVILASGARTDQPYGHDDD